MTPGRGGARPNSGPRGEGYQRSESEAEYDKEKARHERIKADQREFKLAIEMGEYLPRAATVQASATALAILTQSLRSIPDNLERTLALAPEVVEAIAVQIDAALAETAAAFKVMSRE